MDMLDELIKQLENEEAVLQFFQFTNEDALNIGLKLIEQAKKEQKSITIDINRNGQQIFHYACEGTSPDNDQWILRKNRVVNRFNRSSFLLGTMLRKSGKSIEEALIINSSEYSPHGGAFPIRVKNVGVIGTITVSGLPQEEDHAMVVSVIKEYLKL